MTAIRMTSGLHGATATKAGARVNEHRATWTAEADASLQRFSSSRIAVRILLFGKKKKRNKHTLIHTHIYTHKCSHKTQTDNCPPDSEWEQWTSCSNGRRQRWRQVFIRTYYGQCTATWATESQSCSKLTNRTFFHFFFKKKNPYFLFRFSFYPFKLSFVLLFVFF